jgi:hypothetical protein
VLPLIPATPFTVITVPSGVQALRDSGPSNGWLSGITLVDLDHDGDLDLLLADHLGTLGLAALNDGKGNFTKVAGTYPTNEIHMASTSTKTSNWIWTGRTRTEGPNGG